MIDNKKEVLEPKPKKPKVDNSQVLLLSSEFLETKLRSKRSAPQEKMELINFLMNTFFFLGLLFINHNAL